ncbi:Predicted PurR-regulated permease PerM [Methanosarcina thermophila]|jgi:AI-2 transport protein TqsA|uniref:Predicted PurR-regulated permease PerM n=4 Tax=Methanosarcina thermophila TaxID=2210 RepID=A0A1I7ABQ0_METTE|nr:AI-2E family transporter [Methanosarcina thermophila]NLU57763.1 AI-2E family transporter [Methanosarcina thermophila]SFT72334.1 Predicted PurR-regulated permease PerM [Methanosarcina thermophila]HOA69243.1 AI-2E family transporter [Methanosarcina thermophila]HOQ65917.1 AI-2E family transporter [Methanosarcina thermophila]HPT81249.1 AI-2E family transporter [Methanosarcina thermophila]
MEENSTRERSGDVNMNTNTISTPAKILIYSTAAVILTLGMKAISDILVPVFFSLFAFLIFSPLVHWLMRRGVPGKISVFLVILLFIFVFFGTAILFANSLLQLSSRIPSYESQLQSILDRVSRYLPEAGVTVESALQDIAAFAFSVSTDIISGALSAGSTLMLIFITTTFLLLDAAGAPKRVHGENEDQPAHILRFTELSKTVVNYMLLRTETNLVGGIGVAILFLLGGIDFAVLWGLLFFLFGYIPFLGFYLATIPPMLLALFEYGFIGALGVLVGVTIINALVEDVVFPSIAGKSLKLSPTLVFLSLFYWSYVLGTAGALIAVPLTIVVKIVLESSEGTRPMAKLMESSEDRRQDEERIEGSP